MMTMRFYKMLGLVGCLLWIGANMKAQQPAQVFVLGEDEKNYIELNQKYTGSLLAACNFEMDKAFENWLGMMQVIETFSKGENIDLKGVSLWLHVFWNETGHIDHLGFVLRPNSKNIDMEELKSFFSKFIANYTFPVKSNQKFMHYTGATFPTFVQAKK